MSEERGTLAVTEPHPSALDALRWLRTLSMTELATWSSAFASVALSGNRLAEVCSETLNRLIEGKPVSDRYILGLVWAMRYNLQSTGELDEKADGIEKIKAAERRRKRKGESKDAGKTDKKVRAASSRRSTKHRKTS